MFDATVPSIVHLVNAARPLSQQSHAVLVGVDGCRAGWFAFALKREGWEIGVHGDFQGLWSAWSEAALILVDIPIGLHDRQMPARQCDAQARKLLGPRRSSIFPAPSRAALTAKTYGEACRLNKAQVGRGLSQQTFNILHKVREVDSLLKANPAARGIVREVHPELCFWALNCRHSMQFNKRKEAGFKERMRLLTRCLPLSEKVVQEALARYPRKDVGRDDILDAIAAAVIGTSRTLTTIPLDVPKDACGLPMEMVLPA